MAIENAESGSGFIVHALGGIHQMLLYRLPETRLGLPPAGFRRLTILVHVVGPSMTKIGSCVPPPR